MADLDSGEVCASLEMPSEVFSSPVVHGNEIFIGCRDDNVYCLELAKK